MNRRDFLAAAAALTVCFGRHNVTTSAIPLEQNTRWRRLYKLTFTDGRLVEFRDDENVAELVVTSDGLSPSTPDGRARPRRLPHVSLVLDGVTHEGRLAAFDVVSPGHPDCTWAPLDTLPTIG